MLIEKLIQTRDNIVEPNLLYSSSIDDIILDNLRQRFTGKCYMSCLITEVVEIVKRSNLILSKTRQDGSFVCNIIIKIRGIVIPNHGVVHNAVVKNIDKQGRMICKNDNSAIYVHPVINTQTIRIGQSIPVISRMSRYKQFKKLITVDAIPFIPSIDKTSETIYKVDFKHTPLVTRLFNKLNIELEKNKKLDKKVCAFFTELLYPYKTKVLYDKTVKNKNVSVVNIKDFINDHKEKSFIISSPDWVPKNKNVILSYTTVDTKNILNSEELKKTNRGIFITEKYEVVVGYFIQKLIEYNITVRNLCTTYNTMKLIKDNKNLWTIYKTHRKTI